jgi:polyphosphate glucokinase
MSNESSEASGGSNNKPRRRGRRGSRLAITAEPTAPAPGPDRPPSSILVIDVGGTRMKVLASGQSEPRRHLTGPEMTPQALVTAIQEMTTDWEHEAISLGYPGPVGSDGPRSEPGNLGPGWVGFNFAAAFGKPVRIMNDAAMQALGSYDGGRMLFLGLGTGLGSALIADSVIVPLELGHLPAPGGGQLWQRLGRAGLRKSGKRLWRKLLDRVVPTLMTAFEADYVVLGGGNAKKIKTPPAGARLSNNLTAFRGGFRLWHLDDIKTLSGEEEAPKPSLPKTEWRVI